MRLRSISAFLLGVFWATCALGATLRVPSEYPTINAALDVSDFGDSVLVAPGVYTEAETRVIDVGGGGLPTVTSIAFLRDGVALVSEGGPTMTALDITGGPIVGQGWVLVAGLLPSDDTVVDGFRIQGMVGLRGAHFQNSGKITVRNCEFLECSFDAGAGTIESVYSDLELTGSLISGAVDNVASAVRVTQGDVYMEDCAIEQCTATFQGTVTVEGDTFDQWTGEMVIRNSRFRDNVVLENGSGGIWQDGDGYLVRTIEGCSFEANQALGSGGFGVLVLNASETPDVTRITGNLFANNSAGGQFGRSIGGIVAGNILVEGNTFYGNVQMDDTYEMLTLWGGGNQTTHNIFAENFGAPPVGNHVGLFECNVFWNNEPALDPLWVGGANRTVPPQFCDPRNGDYTLMTSSPCLPANSEGCGLIGAFGQGCGPVSVTQENWGTIKARYRGEAEE